MKKQNRYDYQKEEQALKAELKHVWSSHKDLIIEIYLEKGFENLCRFLKFQQSWQPEFLFNYLVYEQNVILKCIERYKDFFIDLIGKGQGSVIRHVLGIQFSKYDHIWEKALYVLNNQYTQKLIEDKLFHLASQSFFEIDKRFKRKYK